jgi:hypothetical protein
MARQKAVDTKIQVTRGFVTEFTPVGFPQEAAIDIDNCIIDTDGSVRRRPGIDIEHEFVLNNINGGQLGQAELESLSIGNFLWRGVANSGTLNIVVVQIGVILQFYAQIGAVSANLLGEVNLTAHAVSVVRAQGTPLRFASGLGSLYLTSEDMELLRIVYDGTTFTVTAVNIQQRDFTGLDDSLATDERPTTLNRNHYYNLLNQGWTDVNIKVFGGVGAGIDLCNATGGTGLAAAADWPSNADIMTVGIVTNSSGDLEFQPDFIREDFLGNTPAPKGHFILDAFFKNYDVASGCAGIGTEVINNRPEGIAFHNGRVFFSSPVVQNKVSGIFYSQNLLDDTRVGLCFQEADPTASEINDLIDTDGGFLPTPGIGQIISMEEFGNGVIILASNGVWYLTGAELGAGITATSIRLEKVHASGVLSASSVVQAEGQLYYWGTEGIMVVAFNEAGMPAAVSITQNSIQQFYVNISATARKTASSVFIPEQRKIYWAYHDTAKDVTTSRRNANKMLILDLDIKGFYKYSIGEDVDNNFPEIMGLSKVEAISAGTSAVEVVTDSTLEAVVDSGGNVVTTVSILEGAQVSTLKMATMMYSTADAGYKITFSTIADRAFVDWRFSSGDGLGLPMSSFVEFAEFNLGSVHTKGNPTYVHSYFSTTSKNLNPGGYYELPPRFFKSTGLRLSQSVLEVLHKPQSEVRLSQSVLEVLHSAP